MAMESSTTATSGRSGGGGASADSYIGCLISLTSKSEIRYEGILYNINTEESSIGLRNVRSFGTEGRKKDGPQVPPSDKIYEYILFRGSDIKDLQVKASPPIQTTPPINSDPAIIQSHYPHPPAPATSLPAAPNGSLPDHGSHSAQMGLPGSTFQNSLHLYQPGGNLNSWGPSPPNANGSGLAMPMYWQGYYGTPNGLPQLPQQSLLRPPPGLSIPPSMQQMQISGFSSSLPMASSSLPTSTPPDYGSSLVPNDTNSSSLTSTSLTASTLPLNIPPLQPVSLVSGLLINPLPNKGHISAIPTSTPSSSLPSLAQLPTSVPDNAGLLSVASKPSTGPVALPQQTLSQHGTSSSGTSGSVLTEMQTPSLITPGQLLHSAPQTLQTMQKDVEVVQVSSKPLPEPSVPVAPEAQPPILPLPPNSRVHKPNGGAYHMRNNYRGRGGRGSGISPPVERFTEVYRGRGGRESGISPPVARFTEVYRGRGGRESGISRPVARFTEGYKGRGGRGSGISRPVARFTEDFDFMAMNEKFKKHEVWGHLGKSNKSQSKDKEENGSDEEDDLQGEDDAELPKIDIKPVYNKDEFFDSLSCNALNNDPNRGRTRYSEQMKLDTETFGDFSMYRGGRGGRGPGRGGGWFRGSYHGRGYGGYGYVDRGRGRGMQSRPS